MKVDERSTPLEQVKYSDIKVRFVFSLIGGYVVAGIGRWGSIKKLTDNPQFWKVGWTTAIFAFVLISLIRQSYLWLDKKITWEKNALVRLTLQFLISWLLPFLSAFLYASKFQYPAGTSMWENGWFERYGLTDGMLLAGVNVYYIFWYIAVRMGSFKKKELPIEQAIAEEVIAEETVPELQTPESGILEPTVTDDDTILFITNKDEIKVCQRKSGLEVICDGRSMRRIFESLTPSEYQIFGTSSIIRLDNILRAEDSPDGAAYAIMKEPAGKKIYVSKRQKNKLHGFFEKKG
ncbi:hypothetical protein ACXZ1K_16050 [Pedobacter sp. PWIIR3]